MTFKLHQWFYQELGLQCFNFRDFCLLCSHDTSVASEHQLRAAYEKGVHDARQQAQQEHAALEHQRESDRVASAHEAEHSLSQQLEQVMKSAKLQHYKVPHGPTDCVDEEKKAAQCLTKGGGLDCGDIIAQLQACAVTALVSSTSNSSSSNSSTKRR
jgi:hypothetical protein